MKRQRFVVVSTVIALALLYAPNLGSGRALTAPADGAGMCAGTGGGRTPALVPFTSTIYPYCIDYPAGWSHQAGTAGGPPGDAFSAPARTHGVAATVSVSAGPVPPSSTDASLLRGIEDAVQKTEHVSPQTAGFALVAGHRLTLVAYTGQQSGNSVTTTYAALALGVTGWYFELTTAPSVAATLRSVFVAMLSTFRVLMPPPVGTSTGGTGGFFISTSPPAITTYMLFGASCPSANRCLAVGTGGTILLSADGGVTWTSRTVDPDDGWGGVGCASVHLCVVVGGSGAIATSGDGGVTWTIRASATENQLNSVSCPSPRLCVAVGGFVGNGAIVTSADGGVTWTNRSSHALYQLGSVSCPSERLCVAVGTTGSDGFIETSTDGGISWTSRDSGTDSIQLASVTCPSVQLCLAVGPWSHNVNGLIITSTDGGSTWTSRSSGTVGTPWAITCSSISRCLAVGAGGTIVASLDGGATWASRSNPLSGTGMMLRGIACASTRLCVAAGGTGGSGVIVTSRDGGATWTSAHGSTGGAAPPAPSPSGPALPEPSGDQGACAGLAPGGSPVLVPFTSTLNYCIDYPAGWSYQVTESIGNDSGDAFVAPTRADGVTDSVRVFRSNAPAGATDASVLQFVEVGAQGMHISLRPVGLAAVAGHRLTLVSYDGQRDLFSNTWEPGGRTVSYTLAVLPLGTTAWVFELGTAPQDAATLRPVFVAMLGTFQVLRPPPAGTGAASGTGGTISPATGISQIGNWTRQRSGTALPLDGASCASLSLCVAVGQNGTTLTSRDGGATWTSRSSGTHNQLYGVTCAGTSLCLAVGDHGTIVSSADGGAIWTSRSSGTHNRLRGVGCASLSLCVAVGDEGTALTSADGGATWSSRPSGTGNALLSVSCPSAGLCLAVGESGTVLTSVDRGATWSSRSSGTAIPVNGYTGVSCTAMHLCMIVGGARYPNRYQSSILLHSTDAGATWTSGVSSASFPLSAVHCPSAPIPKLEPVTMVCRAVGDRGTILTSGDGGATWGQGSQVTISPLYGVTCPSAMRCLAVGDGGTILQWKGGLPPVRPRRRDIRAATRNRAGFVGQFAPNARGVW